MIYVLLSIMLYSHNGPFAFVLLSFCVSRIYVRLSTPHITCIYNRSMMYHINIFLARNVWYSRIPK